MDPSDERHIERFVRNPEGLSDEDRRAVERMIERDPGARTYAEFLEDFYDRLDDEPRTSSSDRVDEFVDELFREDGKSVVSLQPFRPRREARPTVLAADTDAARSAPSSDERRFLVLTTLAAEAEDLLVRVVKDQQTGQGRLYVLSEPSEQRAHVIVSFPEFGLDLVADEEGRRAFDVPPGVSPEQWAEAQAVVRRPVATRAMGPGEETTIPLSVGGTLVGEREGEVLRVALESSGPDTPSLLTVTAPERAARLFRLEASSSLECDTSPEVPVVLRVYE